MLKAIHKPTGNYVSSFKLENDSSWIGREKDEWIAPNIEILNLKELKEKGITEVPVSFIKSHERTLNGLTYKVTAHFRSNCEFAKISSDNESDEHYLAKIGIYEDLWDNKIKVNGREIKEISDVEDIIIEMRLSKDKGSKIADVGLLFHKEHELYGKGIIFEIQFSDQSNYKEIERDYQRVIEGFSVVWLYLDDFKGNKLKDKNVIVNPFVKSIEIYKKEKKEKWFNEINDISLRLDKKTKKTELQLNSLYSDYVLKMAKRIKELEERLEKTAEEKIQEELDFINDQIYQNIASNKVDYNILLDKIIPNLNKVIQIDYDTVFKKSLEEINQQIQVKFGKISDEEIKKQLCSLIEKEFSKNKVNFSVISCLNCEKCNELVSYNKGFFEKGKFYCEKCFNDLEDNWKKNWNKNYRKFPDEEKKEKQVTINEVGNGKDKD
jgi:hypothetical protein